MDRAASDGPQSPARPAPIGGAPPAKRARVRLLRAACRLYLRLFHGLTFGLDGLLYMTSGNPDGYRLRRPDGSFLTGESGALIRCRPDGSNPEVISRGFENLVEVVFLPDGRVVGTYIHGLFADDRQRTAWLKRFAATTGNLSYDATIEQTLDALAAHLAAHLDLDRLLKLAR